MFESDDLTGQIGVGLNLQGVIRKLLERLIKNEEWSKGSDSGRGLVSRQNQQDLLTSEIWE